ncbi:MAG: hypothetical protein A2252_01020 [Elusimicrobia bacterium RIFOXYA2_FULL_39_19]|nr:MAG: hypothetical protein A2252_01020 [Elusimicrobia bacterium RIFOXYA2_FULL_39_19]
MKKKVSALIFNVFLICLSAGFIRSEDFSYRMETFPYNQSFDSGTLYVVVSFDGCKELDKWQDIISFSKTNDIKFTFFISAVYFIPQADKTIYFNPVNPIQEGVSNIGFGGTDQSVSQRKAYVLEAEALGSEIGSHLCGHFDAKTWDKEDWRIEFDEFAEICSFLTVPVKSVRFPYLAMNKYVYPVMGLHGFTSIVSVDEDEFDKYNRVTINNEGENYSFLEFPMGSVQEGKSRVLMMDYNFFVHDKNNGVNPQDIEQKTIDTYLKEAASAFAHNRPLLISHHFSVNDFDNAYWNAMKKSLLTLKEKYPVKFITVSELTRKCQSK